MLAVVLVGVSLLLNPGPQTDCVPWPTRASCMYAPDPAHLAWHRLFRGSEGVHRGVTSVSVRGKGDPNPCTELREVTTVHYHYRDVSFTAHHRFGDFRRITWEFDARLTYYRGPPDCRTFPTAYVTADTAIIWPNGQWYLLGCILHIPADAWKPPPGMPFWSDGGKQIPSAHRTLVVATDTPPLTGMWQRYTFDLTALYPRYFTPPAGYTWADAIVDMAELYVHARGADLEIDGRNHDVIGW